MSDLQPTKGFTIQNDSGEAIPPNSIVVVTSVENIASTSKSPARVLHHAKKYTGQAGNIYVTGDVTIPKSMNGRAYADGLLYVAIEPGVSSPAVGSEWGPVSGKWFIGTSGRGFFAQGNKIQNVRPASPGTYSDSIGIFSRLGQAPWYWAKATTAIAAGTFEIPTSFTFDVWLPDPGSPPAFAVTTDTSLLGMIGVNRTDVFTTSGQRIRVQRAFGEWTLVGACCT